MNEEDAVAQVAEYARGKYPNYPVDALVAARFEIGWTVFPRRESSGIESVRPGEPLFLIGDSGAIMEASGSRPPHERIAEFMRRYGNAS
jgi:hypothetical protein